MQFSAQSSIDIVAEFEQLVGDLFKNPARRDIELLKSRIEERRRTHKNTVLLQHQLCELMARQIKREIAA